MAVDHEPSLIWSVPRILKKHDAIISLIKKHRARYLKHMHKFGIECSRTVEDAIKIDKFNDKTIWADAIAKKMKNVQVAFNPLEDGVQITPWIPVI